MGTPRAAPVRIRTAGPQDAAALLGLKQRLDQELTVMAHNSRAIRLYKRMGFSVEGRRAECLFVDGQFIDELTMAAILPITTA